MFNRDKALFSGLIQECHATLRNPVTVSGYYRCQEGHSHYVSWSDGFPQVSSTGYLPEFLAALEKAEEAALAKAEAGSRAYTALHNAVLRDAGFGEVCL